MKIMVCYDGSNEANEALRLTKIHAKAFRAEIYVVTSRVGGAESPQIDYAKIENDFRSAEIFFKEDKIPCETRLSVRGLKPGEDLVKFARENKIDEIVIGVNRKSKVGKLLFGSTAQYVILQASCPVLTVK